MNKEHNHDLGPTHDRVEFVDRPVIGQVWVFEGAEGESASRMMLTLFTSLGFKFQTQQSYKSIQFAYGHMGARAIIKIKCIGVPNGTED